ncbi:hypothetical protein GCK32_019313 [Trichostrongylus colubriformis]|uniref:Uncharacterized protein n=1 Tax=Trichostrongylus colubriformis TaxID=6319 RepID=A0AAN8IEW6_TRICO
MFYEREAVWNTLHLYDYHNISGTPGIVDDSKKQSWYFGEPIWVTNEKADPTRHSACIQWPACDAEFPNANKPTFYTYVINIIISNRVKAI